MCEAFAYDLMRRVRCRASERLESIQRGGQAEIAKLQALLRKAEMRVTSFERTIEQKTKENDDLTAICDDLIAKVGA